jgi:hypothetical protein
MIRFLLACFLAITIPISATPETPEGIATEILAPLLDPAKVATLKGDRPANSRLYKVLYWLETARKAGGDAGTVIDTAQKAAGYSGSSGAKADKQAILWSRKNLESWGCFTPEGMEKLRNGGSPIITKGEDAGDSIALDHVLPRAVVPELAARFYNLEAIPAKDNLRKSSKITAREVALARRWHRDGLLSAEGFRAIENALITPQSMFYLVPELFPQKEHNILLVCSSC